MQLLHGIWRLDNIFLSFVGPAGFVKGAEIFAVAFRTLIAFSPMSFRVYTRGSKLESWDQVVYLPILMLL